MVKTVNKLIKQFCKMIETIRYKNGSDEEAMDRNLIIRIIIKDYFF